MQAHLGLSDFYLECSRGYIPGAITVHKFGLAEDVDTGDGVVDIWDGSADDVPNKIITYNWATTNDIGQISSTSALDTQTIELQGLDADWNLITQEVQLDGQNPVVIPIPMIRFFRGYTKDTTEFVGFIYISRLGSTLTLGVPPDLDVFGIIHDHTQQTQMAIYTVPAGYSLYITHAWGHVSKNTTTEVVIEIKRRLFGGVFRTLHTLALQTSGSSGDQRPYTIPLKMVEKSDIIYKVQSYTNNTAVAAGFHGVLLPNNNR